MEFAWIGTGLLALACAVLAALNWRIAKRERELRLQREMELAGLGSHAATIAELKSELLGEREARYAAERQASVAAEQVRHSEQRMAEHAKIVEEMKQAATASVMEAGTKMSSKLLEDHKRENEEVKKHAEVRVRALNEQFEHITKSVAALSSKTDQSTQQMDTVMRALTNPAGAGQMSEIGLENTLKNLGLEAGRDFIMQYHVATEAGGKLRPDVVVFLPQDMVMVVDSKASQFLFKLAEAEGTAQEAAVLQQFVASTRQHIDALARKQYADEVAAMLKKQGRQMGMMFSAMYLNSDAAIEKLRHADAGLMEQCEKAGIFIVGPAGLSACFSIARQQIAAAKRDANQQQIIDQLRVLMGNLVTALGYVDSVGKNLQMATKKFGEFAKSMNRSVLPKLRQMEQMGVHPDKNKSLPRSLAYYDVVDHADMVSGEAVEVDEALQIEEKMSA